MNSRSEGFSIVEVLVTMILLGVILTMLGGLTYTTARTAILASNAATRQAHSLELVNRLNALPYAALPAAQGCTEVGTENNKYLRCVDVTVSGQQARLQVTVKAMQRDTKTVSTIRLVRAAPPPPNPFCSGC